MRALAVCMALLALSCSGKPEPVADNPEPKAEPKAKAVAKKNGGSKKGGNAAKAPVHTDPNTLYRDYEDNAAKADAKYKGHPVEVKGCKGKLDSKEETYELSVQVYQRPTINMAKYNRMTQEEKDRWNRGSIDVVLIFPASARDDLAKITEDTPVTVRGKCRGRKPSQDATRGFVVVVEDCELVAPK